MEKTNCLLDAVKNQLQNAISNIDAGNSNLNEEEMEELVKTLSVLNIGEDNIENIKDKIIESAIVNWFEDEDAGIEKVWNYFRAI